MQLRSVLFIIFFVFTTLSATHGYADSELRSLYRGARSTGMGGVSVATANDDEAIFFNPAAAAGFKGTTFKFLSSTTEVSDDVITQAQTGLSSLSNPSLASLSQFIGKNVDLHEQVTSSFTTPGFGIAILFDDQLAFRAQNVALPNIELGYQYTDGLQAAYGLSVLPKNRRSKDDLRLGLAVKMLWRRGGYYPVSLNQLLNIDKNYILGLQGNFNSAIGEDLGVQWIHNFNKRFSITAGAAWTDIGDTKFGGTSDPIKNDLSMGLAAMYTTGKTRATLAYDYRNITQSVDYKLRNHIGMEIAIPVVSIFAGFYQSSFSYGTAVDLGLVRLTALSYTEDLASIGGLDTERRWMLQMSFRVGL